MKKLLILLFLAHTSMNYAQTTNTTVNLKEVTITGNTLIRKFDKILIIPTRAAKHNAYNAYDLMFNMAIPHLQVNTISKDISANSGNVQLRINGIKATQAEVTALLPKEIVRIEMIENPGKRYGDEDLGAVVDIIVHRRDNGGLINLQTINSPHVPFGENFFMIKYNQGKSQWSLNYSLNYRDAKESRTDINETFILENATINRLHKGLNDRRNWYDHNIDLSYNISVPDRYTFNVNWRNNVKEIPHQNESSIINDIISAQQLMRGNTYSPAIELYYQRILPKAQSLTLNLTGTLIHSYMSRSYIEQTLSKILLANYLTDVNEHKQSVIAEAIYDKRFQSIAFSTGLRHYQMYDHNEYRGTVPVISKIHQMRSSAFAELQGKWNKLNYILGAGITRSSFKEYKNEHTYYSFSPTVRLSLAPHKNGYISYRFSTDPKIPSLAALTDVAQPLDTLQVMQGNPYLSMYNVYNQSLSYSYSRDRLLLMFNAEYSYHDNCIMESVTPKANKLIIRQENQKNYQSLQIAPTIIFRSLDIFNLKNFLTLSFETGFVRYWSYGNIYTHTYNNFFYNMQFSLNYKEFNLSGQFSKNRNKLLGETIFKGENQTAIIGQWTHRHLQLGLGMLFPFTNNYKTGKERISSIAPYSSWNYVKESGQLAVVRINYNFEFGKSYHSTTKRINNSDKESGILDMGK